MQHRRAAPHRSGVYAPHVRVGAHARNDLLLLAQHLQGLHPVPEGGGLFKFQILRRLLHLLAKGRRYLPQLAAQQLRRLGHPGLILPLAGAVGRAEAVAFSDVVVEAGPLLADVPGELAVAGGQLQGGAHRLQGRPGLVASAEGAEVPGTVLLRLVHQREPGIGRFFVEPHEGIALVVLQKNIVPGLVPLDQGVLQDQCLELRAHHDGVEVIHLGHHHPGLFVVAAAGLEVLADAVFQLFRLAHIDDQSRLVHHDVHARGQGQAVRLLQQLLFRHDKVPPSNGAPSIARRRPGRKVAFCGGIWYHQRKCNERGIVL